MDLLAYVTGSVEIRAAGKLHTANGAGTFELESASIGGVPISKAFLQEVIAYYSRTPESPEGFNLDQPFKLPQQIRQRGTSARPGRHRAVTASRADWLSTPLQFVKGVGPRRAADLERVGLLTVEDLLLRFPLRYEDRAALLPIARLRPGTTATVAGEVLSSGIRPTRRPGFRLFELIRQGRDRPGAGRVSESGVSARRLSAGQLVVLYGAVEFRGSGGLQLTNPEYEVIRGDADEDDATVHTGRIVPIYEKAGSRDAAHAAHARASAACRDAGGDRGSGAGGDSAPARGLPSRRQALAETHFPPARPRRGGAECVSLAPRSSG